VLGLLAYVSLPQLFARCIGQVVSVNVWSCGAQRDNFLACLGANRDIPALVELDCIAMLCSPPLPTVHIFVDQIDS
jgi:hypothetical protein